MGNNEAKFARGGAELTLDLLDKLKASTDKKNVLISPFSIQTCMALAFAGAKGETAEEIASVMKFASNSPSKVAETFLLVLEKYQDSNLLKMANKIYLQEGISIKPEYAVVTKEQYYAEAELLNFADKAAAAQHINSWLGNKTAGKITDLIPASALDADARLVLLNAQHFKGEWKEKFEAAENEKDDFWLNENDSVQVPMMVIASTFRFGYLMDLECEALELPYKDSDLSMFVLLPLKREGLQELSDKLKGVNLLDLDKELTSRYMVVRFPKFKVEYSIELSDVLKEIGITKAFDGSADFSNICESAECNNISQIFHKTSIEVNEEGGEAAPETELERTQCIGHMIFTTDHPFLYFVWNKKNILFAGAFKGALNKLK